MRNFVMSGRNMAIQLVCAELPKKPDLKGREPCELVGEEWEEWLRASRAPKVLEMAKENT